MASSSSATEREASKYQPVTQSEGHGNQFQDDNQTEASGDADKEADQLDDASDMEFGKTPFIPAPLRRPDTHYRNSTLILSFVVVVLLASNLYTSLPYYFRRSSLGVAGSCPCPTKPPPQYFQTSPELWAGPTATGKPAFMAQTRVIEPSETYVPNEPLQTSVPIEGMKQGNESIFKLMGYLSPYSPSPGFGVSEYPLPEGADLLQVQMLSRHGARYPTTGADVEKLGQRIAKAGDDFKPKGDLGFLKDWKYQLGAEILVAKGRQELYDSGTMKRTRQSSDHLCLRGKQVSCIATCMVNCTTPIARSLLALQYVV